MASFFEPQFFGDSQGGAGFVLKIEGTPHYSMFNPQPKETAELLAGCAYDYRTAKRSWTRGLRRVIVML
ncbi:MAG: hypothetical protein ACYC6N_08065, partial [Pirellulaceae bacterium]